MNKKIMLQLCSLLSVVALVFGLLLTPLVAITNSDVVSGESTTINQDIDAGSQTQIIVEEQKDSDNQDDMSTNIIKKNAISNDDVPPRLVKENPDLCLVGTSTIAECFTDIQFAKVIAKMVNDGSGMEYDFPGTTENTILTSVMAQAVTQINGNRDVLPFVTKNAQGEAMMPKMDGLGIFPNLRAIHSFGFYYEPFAGGGFTDVGITDFSKWSEATQLTIIQDIYFQDNKLTMIDLTSWGTLTNLIELSRLDFSRNQLTTIGNLGKWGNMSGFPQLKLLGDLNFIKNQLTDIGDLGQWGTLGSFPRLTELGDLYFAENKLTDIGNLGRWGTPGSFPNLERLSRLSFEHNKIINIGDLGMWGTPGSFVSLKTVYIVDFSFNEITNIGDLGIWGTPGSFPVLEMLWGVNFRYNQLTDLGDLGKWGTSGAFPKVVSLGDMYFFNNQLTNIGDLSGWSTPGSFPNVSILSSFLFHNNQLTDIGDLGKWGTPGAFPNVTKLTEFDFSNNQLTSIGDLGKWGTPGAFPNLAVINHWSFKQNKLTTVGDFRQWNNFSPLVFEEMYEIDFSYNCIRIVTIDDEFTEKINSLYRGTINFSNQYYTKESYYVNKHNVENVHTLSIEVDAQNPFNVNDGEYGSYSLVADYEEYKNMTGILITPIDNNLTLPVVIDFPYTVYTIKQINGVSGHDKAKVLYDAVVTHPILWIDLAIDAADFEIHVNDLAKNMTGDADAITLAQAEVILIDEFGNETHPQATVDASELAAIQAVTNADELPKTLPLTFSYAYQGIVVIKQINVLIHNMVEDSEHGEYDPGTGENNPEHENTDFGQLTLVATGEHRLEVIIWSGLLLVISLVLLINRKYCKA